MSGTTASCSQAKVRAGAAEPGLDLVGDHQHVVLDAQPAHVVQVAGRRHDHAGFALHRLDQDGHGRLVDRRGERVGVAVRHRAEAGRVGAVVGLGDVVAGEADDADRAAVEVAVHDHDRRVPVGHALDLVAPAPGHLQRGLDALGAGVHRQHHLLAGQRRELGAERPEQVVVEGPAGEGQPVQLLLGGGDERRVPVAEVDGGVRRQEVEVPVAVVVPHPRPLAVGHHHRQRVVVVRAVDFLELDRTERHVPTVHHGRSGRRPDALHQFPSDVGRAVTQRRPTLVAALPQFRGFEARGDVG